MMTERGKEKTRERDRDRGEEKKEQDRGTEGQKISHGVKETER
jgi:hypothetical protein